MTHTFLSRLIDKYWNMKNAIEYKGIIPFELSESMIDDKEKNRTDLHRIFYGNDGPIVHKWLHYIDVYNQHLSKFKGTNVRLLELGVSQGGSLRMWKTYLGRKATVYGIDIEERCRQFDGNGVHVRIGSQADKKFLASVHKEMGQIDIIIDDGSHIASHQIISFETLFPFLKDGGIYICEDTHTAYWGHFGGGYRRKGSFIEYAKRIVDDMHHDFHGRKKEISDADRSIESISFHNSMVVFVKRISEPPAHVRIGLELGLGT